MKKISILLINFYQKYISVLKKRTCVFYPTCSEYAKLSIKKHGFLKGFYFSFLRILRCHPWQKNHIDHIK